MIWVILRLHRYNPSYVSTLLLWPELHRHHIAEVDAQILTGDACSAPAQHGKGSDSWIPGFLNCGSQVFQVFQEQGYLLRQAQKYWHFDRAEQPSVHLCLLWRSRDELWVSWLQKFHVFGEAVGPKCGGPARGRRKGLLNLLFPEPEEGFCGIWGLKWTQDWRGSSPFPKVIVHFWLFL